VAVKIRLMRVGKKKQPSYRVVVADGRSPRDGRYIEIIGQYGPRQDPSVVTIDDDKALAWLRKGAQPTDVIQKLLTQTGVWERYLGERGKTVAPRTGGTKRTEPKLSRKAQARAAAGAGAASAGDQPKASAGDQPKASAGDQPDAASTGDEPKASAGDEPKASADGDSSDDGSTQEAPA